MCGGYSAVKVIICDAIKTWDYKLCRVRVRDSSAIKVTSESRERCRVNLCIVLSLKVPAEIISGQPSGHALRTHIARAISSPRELIARARAKLPLPRTIKVHLATRRASTITRPRCSHYDRLLFFVATHRDYPRSNEYYRERYYHKSRDKDTNYTSDAKLTVTCGYEMFDNNCGARRAR